MLYLLHGLPPPPPQLRGFRGFEKFDIEQRLDREPDAEAATALTRAAVPAESMQNWVRQAVHHEDLMRDILHAAEEVNCRTIVVGRSSFRHLADAWIKSNTPFTIWVMEEPRRAVNPAAHAGCIEQ